MRLITIAWRNLFFTNYHSMRVRVKLLVISDWLMNSLLKGYSRIPHFAKGGDFRKDHLTSEFFSVLRGSSCHLKTLKMHPERTLKNCSIKFSIDFTHSYR